MKPTLFVLAAGMGSRYGSLKQLDGIGPGGDTIMDYSVYDAIRAGFGRLVFVIRHSFEKEFREKILTKYEGRIPVELVFQELDRLPEGFSCPEGREKPWGTNHAVLMGRDAIREPFAVINADDFYGRNGFEVLARKLMTLEGKQGEYCMVGYRVGNTLSESGGVSRGVCQVDEIHLLTGVVERTGIERTDGTISFRDETGKICTLAEDAPVSMNMWGFTPDYFDYSEELFINFLNAHGQEPKSEFFIPFVVNDLIRSGRASVEVLDTTARWFGVTYSDDRPGVVAKLRELTEAGEYPTKLF
ncbi:nucleotidyltransferase family protein [Porphyromonas gingivalis]|uniref:nucleotidyltransferase family protein n=1 Tax=Porphyromonas gingivalis TaxID=837 RepID=UPI003095DB56